MNGSDNSISRLSRITAHLTRLQSKRMITAQDLADQHGVSVRTIYRDIRSMQDAGIPVVMEEGKGYKLMDGYRLPPIMFTEEEANALITAENLILRNKDVSFVNAFRNAIIKIKATLKLTDKNKSELLSTRIIFRQNQKYDQTSDHLTKIQKAITSFELLKISYTNESGVKSQRVLEPFAVYSTNENWLLIAYCRNRHDFRAFRLDRINTLTELSEKFTPHPMTLQEYFDECARKFNETPDS